MGIGEIVAIALAGLAAGAINTMVGSGTLITFPVLLAFGYAPVTANVSNTIGLVPGSLSGAVGYRRELANQRRRMVRLGTASVLGGITGAVLLLVLPASAFKAIVPVFIAIAIALIVLQPRLNRLLAAKRGREDSRAREEAGRGHEVNRAREEAIREHEISRVREGGILTALAVYVTGVYGGYFGAAQGILLLGILGVALPQSLQRTNALKNVLAGLVNGVAGVYFMLATHVEWAPAGIIAGSSILGAQLGAHYGRRLPPAALRGLIVIVGTTAIVRLLVT